MIVFRTPKGWTCPPKIDGKKCEAYWRSHQVPMCDMDKPEHLQILEDWMKSYRPEELFDADGQAQPRTGRAGPKGHRRMSDNPHANGGLLLRDLRMPDFCDYAVDVPSPGAVDGRGDPGHGQIPARRDEAQPRQPQLPHVQPRRDRLQPLARRARGDRPLLHRRDPPETTSSRPDGRVMEVLSEHQCQGWLEGYLLTGRHGFFSCYEAFIHIIDSMFNQHAKWLKVCHHIPWRRPIASLNYLLTSHVWRQDHNGFSHQDPGFIDHVVNKKAEVIRVYLPPDANTLLSVTDHCLRSRNYVNVIVAGKQPAPQWLTMDEAIKHCTAGIGIWEWASNDNGGEPDVVMACCGDVPTLETLAAVELLRKHLPELKMRVVNVVDLMKLQPASEHPHGLSDRGLRRPVHQGQADHLRLSRLSLADPPLDLSAHEPQESARPRLQGGGDDDHAVRHGRRERSRPLPSGRRRDRPLPRSAPAAYFKQAIHEKLIEHKEYIARHGDDMPAISGWRWGLKGAASKGSTTTKATTSSVEDRAGARLALSRRQLGESPCRPVARTSPGTVTRPGPFDGAAGRTDALNAWDRAADSVSDSGGYRSASVFTKWPASSVSRNCLAFR